jgi:hypothetical protein
VYRTVLKKPVRDEKRWVSQELVAGELERRLGIFDAARERFERLRDLDSFKQGTYADIVELQLQLIEARDTRARQVPQRKK